jgi:hypothetical protein
MFITLVVAMFMVFLGTTFVQPLLAPREHPGWFIFFWATCGWLALTAMLLAVLDLLHTRLKARRERRALREKLKTRSIPNE